MLRRLRRSLGQDGAMNPEVEARWTALRDAITRDVGDGWELGDDEPTWAAVKATPVASSNPSNEFW